MKKGIIVLIIAAVMLTACALEVTYVNNTFATLERDITVLLAEIETDEVDVLRTQTLQQAEDILSYWNNRKRLAQVMLNHLLLIEYDAKVNRFKSNIEVNDRNLSKIDGDQLLAMTKELKDLHTPHIHNIF